MKKLLIILFIFMFTGCASLSNKRIDEVEKNSLERDIYLIAYIEKLAEHYNLLIDTFNKHIKEDHGYKPTGGE